MSSDRVDDQARRTLEDFLAFADAGARLVARGRSAYDADEMLQLASEAILHKVGEAIARLPDDVTARHPSVRWRPMKGMRNRIGHEYEVVDYAILWNALERRLPEDAAAVREILAGSV